MLLSSVMLNLLLLLTECTHEVVSLMSQVFQDQNGIVATIDGYIPRCPGCVVFGQDPLIVYGSMHLPQDKLHLLENAYFLTDICAFDMDCSDHIYASMPYCLFNTVFLHGCASEVRQWMHECYCDDAEPKRWYAWLDPIMFEKSDMVIRFLFEADALNGFFEHRPPYVENSTLFMQDLINRGHVVFKRQVSGSTNCSTYLTYDRVLVLILLALVKGVLAS
ncbi:uncharacterized protein LOC131933184 [Physella acuta]|uniref:uncharacterized protein LOC131933184 n=1 Tax=Physella acuta TaxID=109671 RepID=UPI0027DCA4DD|nr:uncharacterized protein LOC131933184 [Physella acuta]XP_059145959.1 uncharacterized protein LOC131933184 [Physella acuta]XP_059145960.1 uncharacterized protein LOC131933184 [Physella acuta]